MAVRRILGADDDLLRKKAHHITKINRRMIALLNDMKETMYAADGCGLAAPQIGILRRAVIIDVGEGLIELINPVIMSSEGVQQAPEGCLSLPGKRGIVERPEKVTVTSLNRYGGAFELTGEGVLARAICHELDHLDGIRYTDNMLEDVTEQYQSGELD
jgi:peptide deformylase